MRSKKLKNAVKTIAFLLIVAVIFAYLSNIFQPKWLDDNGETSTAIHYYEVPEDAVEVLFLGTSQVTCSFDVFDMYNRYGIYAYDLGGSHNPFLANYYWMLDAFDRFENLKTVVIDVSIAYNADRENDINYRKNLGYMKWSKRKFQALYDYYKNIDNDFTEDNNLLEFFFSYVFNLNKYHSRWDSLDKIDFKMEDYDNENFNGFHPTPTRWVPNIKYENFVIDNDTADRSAIFNDIQSQYLDKMIEECKNKGVSVYLVKTPKASWSKSGHDYVQKIADENGIEFIDYNTDDMLKSFGYDFNRDMRDQDHLNARGARKFTRYFTEYLLSKESYTDQRDKNLLDKAKLKEYELEEAKCFIQSAYTPLEYLESLKAEGYTVVIQSNGDISAQWTEEHQKALEALGVTLNIKELGETNYLAVIRDGKLDFEKTSDKRMQDTIELTQFRSIDAVENGMKSMFTYSNNQKDYIPKQFGMYITVFTKNGKLIVSRASLYDDHGTLNIQQ